MKFIFGMQINIEVFYKLILSFWVCAIRYAQSTIIRSLHIFAISPEQHGCKVDFFPKNKRESFLQVDIITLICVARHDKKYPKH